MKVELEKVVTSANSLSSLSNLAVPVGVAFKLSKILNEVQGVMDIFNERRDDAVKKLNETKEELELGEKEELPKEVIEKFNEDMRAILDEEIELNVTSFSIADLGDVKIESSHLMQLNWLLVE